VDQAEGLIGKNLHFESATGEEIIEALEPGLHGCPDLGRKRGAPFAVHPPLGRPGSLNIQGAESGVADYPDAGLPFLRRHLF